MTQKKTQPGDLQRVVDVVGLMSGNQTRAAAVLQMPRPTLQNQMRAAALDKLKPRDVLPASDIKFLAEAVARLTDESNELRTELNSRARDEMTRAEIRRAIFGLKDAEVKAPTWAATPGKGENYGVPTLLASDWHWGEVVNPKEITDANSFNLQIAHGRARKMIERTIKLTGLLKDFRAPGVVFALGGDMVSGDIHEELTATNEKPLLPIVVDLVGVLVWCVRTLADHFGHVYVPAVTGNHGRKNKKPQAKQRAATNFDWLVYQIVKLNFADDRRVVFSIPDGPDAYWNVYGHRYAMTHGDQFRGGDGITGALMPIIRGRHKKSSRDVSLNQPWDTLLMGHWHTLIQLPHVVVNGSLKGYDEYAFGPLNATFERAAQALWITHPTEGITYQMPVYVDESARDGTKAPWVSVFK